MASCPDCDEHIDEVEMPQFNDTLEVTPNDLVVCAACRTVLGSR